MENRWRPGGGPGGGLGGGLGGGARSVPLSDLGGGGLKLRHCAVMLIILADSRFVFEGFEKKDLEGFQMLL